MVRIKKKDGWARCLACGYEKAEITIQVGENDHCLTGMSVCRSCAEKIADAIGAHLEKEPEKPARRFVIVFGSADGEKNVSIYNEGNWHSYVTREKTSDAIRKYIKNFPYLGIGDVDWYVWCGRERCYAHIRAGSAESWEEQFERLGDSISWDSVSKVPAIRDGVWKTVLYGPDDKMDVQ